MPKETATPRTRFVAFFYGSSQLTCNHLTPPSLRDGSLGTAGLLRCLNLPQWLNSTSPAYFTAGFPTPAPLHGYVVKNRLHGGLLVRACRYGHALPAWEANGQAIIRLS